MQGRATPVGVLLGFWVLLYLAVGVDLAFTQGQAAVLDWTRIWAIIGIATAPACFLLGWRVGTRDPRLTAGLVAAASVLLAVFSIHTAVFRAGQEGMAEALMPLSGTLLLGGIALFVLVALVEHAGWSGALRLIVLFFVVIVVAVMLTLNFVHCRCQGHTTACKSNLKNIGTALEMYSTDNAGRYPPSLSLLTPSYIRTIPTCTVAKEDTYSDLYESASHPDAYTVYCAGDYHVEACGGPDQPVYTSKDGLTERPSNEASRLKSPYLHAARVGDELLWVQALFILVGLLLAFDPTRRLVALGLIGFGVIPWGLLVVHFAAPATAYNRCVHNLARLRTGVHAWRAGHPKGGVPPLDELAKNRAAVTCPTSGEPYHVSFDRDGRVSISCERTTHQNAGCPPGRPCYVEADDQIHRTE